MRLIPSSYNGFLFQQTGQVAATWSEGDPYAWNVSGISTNSIERTQNFPLYTSKNYSGAVKVIEIAITACIDDNRDALIKALDVLGAAHHQLFATDALGRLWYVNAICIVPMSVEGIDENTLSVSVAFKIDDPVWRKYVPSAQTINVNGTGAGTMTPVGNLPALPVITITPTAGTYGFVYRRFIQIVNNSPNALTSYPLNLTGAGLATNALVAAGKMLASGDDLRIYVDGVEVKRWLQDMNTANTKIWINWTQPANSDMTLGATIAATGAVSTITIQNNPTNVARMALIPTSGNVLIGSEIFVYAGVNVAGLQLTGCVRAERQTTAAAHAIADAVKFVTHDVWLYYGNPSIAAYVVDDTNKPIIKLTSTNTSHIYEAFGTNTGLRSGGWANSKTGGITVGDTYTTSYGGIAPSFVNPPAKGSPWDVVGQAALFSLDGVPYTLESKLYNPCGITEITSATGNKYRQTAAWNTVTFEKSANGTVWTVVWTEATPSGAAAWEALSAHAAVSLSGTYYFVKFKMYEVPSSGTNNAKVQEVTDVTVVVDSTKVPTITIAAESNAINLYTSLYNAATGFTMVINYVTSAGTYIVVDTNNKTIVLYDGSNQINALINMPIRDQWFPLLPNEPNAITITDSGVTRYDFSFEDRTL